VMDIAPDEESIMPASGLSNKEDLVQKEMDRRCGIDIASTAMSIISLWCVLARIRGPSLGMLGELVCVVLSRSRLQCIVRVGGRLGLGPSRFDRGSTGSVGA
jgi:hypothetical protein